MQDEQYKITDSAGNVIEPGTELYNKIVKKIQNDYEDFLEDRPIKVYVGEESKKVLEEALKREWEDLSKNMPVERGITRLKNVPDNRNFKLKGDHRLWQTCKKTGNEYLIETLDDTRNWIAGAWVDEDLDVLVVEEPGKIYDAKLPVEGTVFPDREVDTDFYLKHLQKTLTDEEIAESYILPNTVTPEQEVEAKRQLGVYRSITKECECPFCDKGTGSLGMQVRDMNGTPTLQYYFECNHCHEEWTTNEIDDATMDNYRAATGKTPIERHEVDQFKEYHKVVDDKNIRIAELEDLVNRVRRAATLVMEECDLTVRHVEYGLIMTPEQVAAILRLVRDDVQKFIIDKIDEHDKSKEGQEG